jgi:hypothetical protein
MTSLAIEMSPAQLLDAWHQDTGRLLVPSPRPPALRAKAAVRIRLQGKPVSITVVGTVVSVHRSGEHHRIELAPDADGQRAVRLLAAAARGETVRIQPRAPRYLARLPVFVDWEGAKVYLATFSVSENGCGLVWSGSLPSVGQALALRFGAGSRQAEFRGVVCWTRTARPNSTVGVRLVGTRGTAVFWEALLGDARRTGLPV